MEGSPLLSYDPESLSFDPIAEADVGLSCLDQRLQLRKVVRSRVRRMGKRFVQVVIERNHFAAQFLEQQRHNPGAGSVAAVDSRFELPGTQVFDSEEFEKSPAVVVECAVARLQRLEFLPISLQILAVVVDLEQLLALLRAQIHTVTAKELEGIPFHRIVSGGDDDGAGCTQLGKVHTDAG